MRNKAENILAIVALGFCLNSCTTPSDKFSRQALDYNFQQQPIDTPTFRHQIFTNQAAEQYRKLNTLHVYLDGDGSPWINKRRLARDPTSRNPLILRLMQLDQSPSILLGRPCYHGLNKALVCQPKYWTSHRYSLQVVESMALALNLWLKDKDYKQVILIGYSGGGVLAMLIAKQVAKLKAVVTVAANLNVSEWSRYHGYSPLYDSLNPAERAKDFYFHQLHIAGADDTVVPAYIIEQFANKQSNAEYLLLADQDHRCCWAQVWPEILELF